MIDNQPDRKFEEVYNVSDYEIMTDTGWRDVRKVCKTVSYKVYKVTLEDGSFLECADDHIVLSEGKEIFVKDLDIGSLVDTRNGLVKCMSKESSDIKENMYDIQVDGGRYYTNDILSHNTTVASTYILWYAMFNSDKTIGIVSNKESSAKMILGRIKGMYKLLPVWLKPGVEEFSKMFVTFDNGTRIIISATSPDAFRGEAINCLLMDEFAFVPRNQADDFWSSNYPTISKSKEAKIIVISTPFGMFNMFHRIYSGAKEGRNSFVPIKVTWERVPGRDEKWAEEQRRNLGKQKFDQEFNCKFLGSINTVIDSNVLEQLMVSYEEPSYIEFDGKFLIYEKPVGGCNYVVGIDVGKGTGEHYSVVQVLKIISVKPIRMEQVAVFIDNLTDVYKFSDIINRISYYYNSAYIMVENNSEGSAVVNRLWWEYENGNLVNTGSKKANLGIRATRSTKPRAVLLMKKLIEDGSLKLIDKETIDQLADYIEKNEKFFGKNKPDDAVSALYWACYLLEMNVLDDSFEFNKKKEEEDGWGILTDVDIVQGEDWSWLTTASFRD